LVGVGFDVGVDGPGGRELEAGAIGEIVDGDV